MGVETCVKPTTSFQGEWNKKVNKEFNWIGQDLEAESGQVMYEPRPTQWNSLRLDHTHARQNVTYNCKNSLAYRTVEGGKHTFLKFLASDSQEVTAFGKRDKMNVLKDECHMKDPVWRKAVFEIDTSVMINCHFETLLFLELKETTSFTPSKWEAFAFIKSLVSREFLIFFVIYNF